jgi:hypothetical protein
LEHVLRRPRGQSLGFGTQVYIRQEKGQQTGGLTYYVYYANVNFGFRVFCVYSSSRLFALSYIFIIHHNHDNGVISLYLIIIYVLRNTYRDLNPATQYNTNSKCL